MESIELQKLFFQHVKTKVNNHLSFVEEIADLLSYLVSPAAKWMTGASVRMDGGEIKGI